jgi:murein DD-endopeptidase MepM/ murein hydrolase activator NlpD
MQLRPHTKVFLNGAPIDVLDNQAVIGFGRDAPLQQQLKFVDAAAKTQTAELEVNLRPRDYQIQRIEGLPQKMVTPPAEALEKIRRQGKIKRAARAESVRQTWFAEPFVWPVEGRISGVYGSQRFYNGEPRRPHFGIDIAAPRKTPVRAPASGRVSLAETDMYFEGGLIFIDHGLSVTSVFMHLDSVHVAVGDIVQQGDVIGRVGSTGRSTGPHLDWRMYWQQQRVDPALLVPPMTAKASTASTGKKP